jgi:hypothetical protein
MSPNSFASRLTAVLAGGALVAMGAFLAGCGNNGEQAPSTSSTTTTTTTTTMTSSTPAPPSPTEKGIDPTGGNLFTPNVKAPPAPTEPPGVHRNN